MVLPRAHVQPEVLHRRRRRDGMAPRRAQPFDAAPVLRRAGDAAQAVDHLIGAHQPQPVEQGAGVFEHHARLEALSDQCGDELAHARIAMAEHRRVVVVADLGMLGHELQVADQRCGAQVAAAGRYERLVHVQRDRTGAAEPVEVDPAVGEEHGPVARLGHGALDEGFGTAEVRQAVYDFGQ